MESGCPKRSEGIHPHDHIYSFDIDSSILMFLQKHIPKGILKTVKDTDIYELQHTEKGKLSLIYCSNQKILHHNNIKIWLSLLHSKGIILIENKSPVNFYKEIGAETFFVDTYFYVIKKN